MGGDWKENHPRRGNEGAPGENLSDWYRRKIDELTTHEQFVELWDKQRERRQAPAQPQGMPAPWEGISQVAQSLGINLGELWKSREDQLKSARDAVTDRDRELHQLRVNEIDRRVQELQAMADKVAQGAQTTQQKGFLDKLDEMTQGLISQRFAAMLGGNNQPAPKDPVDEFFTRLDQVDKLKQRFAPATEGSSMHALAQSGVRTEVVKLLLEDDRERLKMKYDYDTQVERNKHLGGLASVVKENLGDGIRALTLAAQDIKQGGAAAKPHLEQAPTEASFQCTECNNAFGIPTAEGWTVVGCPHCGTRYTREQVLGEK